MPTIQIHTASRGTASAELGPGWPRFFSTPAGLAIIEIQGTINKQDNFDPREPIGRLSFPYYDPNKDPQDTSWHKRVHLHIGQYQRMTGEIKKLPKPFAVLRRRQESDSSSGQPHAPESLEIVDIIYYKLLFAHRPEPVGANGQGL